MCTKKVVESVGSYVSSVFNAVTGGIFGGDDKKEEETQQQAPQKPSITADTATDAEQQGATLNARRVAEKQRSLLAKGMNSTIGTSALGITSKATTAKKTLLGG